jgi:hypothetical protein
MSHATSTNALITMVVIPALSLDNLIVVVLSVMSTLLLLRTLFYVLYFDGETRF